MGKRKILYVKEGWTPNSGFQDVNLLLIEQAEGSFRKANGNELAVIIEDYPHLINHIEARYGEDEEW
ncbi:hypothetical protein ACFOWX_09665 [Sphingorhabdus arenilitoris]|uniref:Uncharacterized protein n=1 Tax=Sphingorhabdus arenilitoris TaxID=1490041 RepID=A0ABV8RH21_9SPHN